MTVWSKDQHPGGMKKVEFVELLPQRSGHPAAQGASGSGFLMALFLAMLMIPISLDLAGLRLSPYRILLLVLFFPFLLRLLSGHTGRLNMVDVGMAGFALWMIVTLVYHHGSERLAYAIILAVEVFGGYMAGRLLIRSAADYQRFIRYFLVLLAILVPFALYELFYSRMPIADLFRAVFDVTKKNQEFRYGLARVQVVFPHSILYGLFCSLALASVYYIYRSRPLQMVPRLLLVTSMTLMSLSSAPLLSIAMQLLMIFWDKVTRGSWKLLAALTAALYIFLELASNRGAVVIFFETLTISPQSGWWRIHIWRHGSAAALNHPIMGIGLNDWVRPVWLTSSVDNFWLLMAMRHGLVGIAFLGMAVVLHVAYVTRANLLSDETRLRTGYGITLVGLLFVLSTVHVWNELAVFVMFFLGAGSFLYRARTTEPEETADYVESPGATPSRSLPFTRFPRALEGIVQGNRVGGRNPGVRRRTEHGEVVRK
jgi:hypothetical protein